MRKRHHHDRRKDRQFWKLWNRQDGQCAWCDQRMTTHRPDAGQAPNTLMATIDHVIPKAQGGGHDRPNRVLACRDCNERRGRSPQESGAEPGVNLLGLVPRLQEKA